MNNQQIVVVEHYNHQDDDRDQNDFLLENLKDRKIIKAQLFKTKYHMICR